MPPTPEPTASRGVSPWAWVAVAAVVVVYALLVVGAVRGRGAIWHDEAVSVIGAAGHLDEWHRFEFEGAFPYGEWTTAAEFHRFHSVDRPLDLQGVSRSLGDYDWAPPGFFWLLHLARLAGVPVLWSGAVVNIFLGGVAAVIAFRLVLRLTGSVAGSLAATAAALWSPALALAGGEARHYMLYGVALLALGAWSSVAVGEVRVGAGPGRRRLMGLAAITAGGMLANHQFVFNALVAVLLVVLLSGAGWRTARRIGGAFVAGAALSWLVFPYYFIHFGRLGEATPGFSLDLVAGRASRWLTGAFDVVTLDPDLQGLARTAMRLILIGAVLGVALAHRRVWRWIHTVPDRALPILLAVGSAIIPAAAYALQSVLEFVEGGHYIAPLWPLTAVGLAVVLVSAWRRAGPVVVGVLAATLLVSTSLWVASVAPGGAAARRLLATVASGDAIVVDCVSRGYFPTVSPSLDPSTPVYVARGSDLVAAIGAGWEPPIGDSYFLHASCPGGADVIAVVDAQEWGEVARVGTLERFEVWLLTRDGGA